ncbi:uncharacterized protein LOC131623912 [Vicia villosa]|uniref:uncharacterized protein LOC131623912 n=1 Tax=Vicia villosa TaxID=3911 RepID=UPI00273BA602|nr:uncharacterized protein LOC131623912 [Vicia villosa]
MYDGKSDPQEHVIAINNQMEVIAPTESLKCNLMAGTWKDVALRWYMILPQQSISSYQDLTKKLVQHFSAVRRRKVSTTILFTVRQGPSESLREYLARFNEETTKVSHPNQELFVGAFQHILIAGHFNESLVQKPESNMDEIITQSECYIKREDDNREKRIRDSAINLRPREGESGKREAPRERRDERPSQKPLQRPQPREETHNALSSIVGDIF